MKNNFPFKVVCIIAGILVAVLLVSFGLQQQESSAREDAGRQQYYARIREGLGSEVNFAAKNASHEEIRASVESVAAFMNNRSGFALTTDNKEKLISLELNALNDRQRLIKFDELINILTELSLERVSKLSDQEVDQVVEIMRGFDAPDLPESFKKGQDNIKLRASVFTDITPAELREQLIAMRDKSAQKIAKGYIKDFFQESLITRLQTLSAALPEHFGKSWNKKEQRADKGLTPIQAFLVTYSIASDDLLSDSNANLTAGMYRLRDKATEMNGHFPDPTGHKAYGSGGYIYSFPLDIALDSQTQASLLEKFEKGVK